jgi:hypothetical protein
VRKRHFPILATIFTAGILLAGCSEPAGLKALERTVTADDELPAGVSVYDIELNKVILAAEAGDKKYYLGQDVEGQQVCLIAVSNDGSFWNAGCSERGTGELFRTGGADQVTAILVADGYNTSELESTGWIKIHDNILIPEGKA